MVIVVRWRVNGAAVVVVLGAVRGAGGVPHMMVGWLELWY